MRLRRILLGIVGVGLALTVGGYFVLSMAPFGAPATGERLARIENHPMFVDGAFTNVEPQAESGSEDALTFLKRQFFYDEVRVPPTPRG